MNEYTIADKIADAYYFIYNNNRVDLERLIIHTTENDIYYKNMNALLNDMLDDILIVLERGNITA